MLVQLVSGVRQISGQLTKKPLESFNMLETVASPYAFIADDGSLATVIRIDGFKNLMGKEELHEVIRDISTTMTPYLSQKGHAIQVWFARDPDIGAELVHEANRPAVATANAIGLELSDLFEERERKLSEYVSWEGFYFVLWTRTSILSPEEFKAWRQEISPPKGMPVLVDAQSLHKFSSRMLNKHDSFAQNMVIDLKQAGVRSCMLDTHEALRMMRASVYPDQIATKWTPSLPGDPILTKEAELNNHDASHLLCRDLNCQIFDREAEHLNPRVIRMGAYYMGSLEMIEGFKQVKPFSDLMVRMTDTMGSRYPWRVSFLIEGGHGVVNPFKDVLLAILGNFSGHNKMMSAALNELKEREQEGETIVDLRISFATWAKIGQGNVGQIEERLGQLQRTIESWGAPRLFPLSGDAVEGVMSSVLGLHCMSTAPVGKAPLTDVITMIPWDRDNSPWEKGAMLFRTEDGRVWPYQPGSSKQATWVELYIAASGRGKSVLLNSLNLSTCLSPDSTKGGQGAMLPRIGIIDIGHSSSGFISLIRESLPETRKHEAIYKKLKMIKEHAINPFDTQLGCRRPLPAEKTFLRNFISALCTPEGKAEPNMLSDLAGKLVEDAYSQCDDTNLEATPHIYDHSVDLEVDAALKDLNLTITNKTTWWQIVDALFEKGLYKEASLAQRHAVPQIKNLKRILRANDIQKLYGGVRTENNEPLIDYMETALTAGLSNYPILGRPTQFDIGNARICSLNLEEVAHGKKQTSLVYMLGRFALAKDFYLRSDDLKLIPERYKTYHEKRIKDLSSVPKRLVYDEFHRTDGAESVRRQVSTDIREGRKYGVHIALCSQLPEDFDKPMIDNASSIWILGADSKQAVSKIENIFGLSPTATQALTTKLRKPTAKGAPVLGLFSLDDGRHEHLLYNTLSATELWAFTTTTEDVMLRDELYVRLGAPEARKRLARRFPSGSAQEEISRRTALLSESGNVDDSGKVITLIADELSKW